MIKKFINIIFPQVCTICGKLSDAGICNKCQIKLKKIAESNIINPELEEKNFNQLIYIFKYESLIRRIILDYKFNEKSYMYEGITAFILSEERIIKKLKTYDIFIPVPISKKRQKERGYNQSILIARKLSQELKIPIQTNCLYKTKNIIEQSKLNKEERKQNIQNVYQLKNKQILNNKQILLIDDIYTTGSTVNECAKILKQGRPKNIDVLVIARD